MSRNLQRLLSIEDDKGFQDELCSQLSSLYDIDKAWDCESGKIAFSNKPYNIILLDKYLPDGIGFSLIPTIKALNPQCIIILLTGDRDFSSIFQALAAGANDYINKPFSIDLKKNEKHHTFIEELILRIRRSEILLNRLSNAELTSNKIDPRQS